MFVRLISDIHLEMCSGVMSIPELPNEKNIVLVLAGDIGVAVRQHTYAHFVREMAKRHRAVIYVPGNHEFYHGSIVNGLDKLIEGMSYSKSNTDLLYPDNLHIVNNEIVTIDNVAFICATMWTNLNNNDPIAMYDIQMSINDFDLVRDGTKNEPYRMKFIPSKAYTLHQKSKTFAFDAIREQKAKGLKTFVVTHFALTKQMIHEQYKTGSMSIFNPYYTSDYDDLILETKPDVCVNGHVHNSFKFNIGDTRFYCNPGDYPHQRNKEFDPNLLIEI